MGTSWLRWLCSWMCWRRAPPPGARSWPPEAWRPGDGGSRALWSDGGPTLQKKVRERRINTNSRQTWKVSSLCYVLQLLCNETEYVIAERYIIRPDRPWGPPSLLYNGYRVSFPGVRRPRRGVNQPPLSSADVKEKVELYLYSSSGPSWSVQGWNFTFTFAFRKVHNPLLSHSKKIGKKYFVLLP